MAQLWWVCEHGSSARSVRAAHDGRPNGAVEAARRAGIGAAALSAAFAVGAVAAQVRTWIAREPAYVGSRDPVEVIGWVSEVDASNAAPRLRLLVSDIEGGASPPRYVRLAVRTAGLLSPGRAAHCRAVIGPPSGPLAPAGFKQRCRLNALIDAADLTREGGGFIYAADGAGLVIQRATPPTIRRAWTPSQLSIDKDQP